MQIEVNNTYHNGKNGDKYRARKVIGFDGRNGVDYIDVGSGKIGNCSIETMKRFAKGKV
ncbi:hypothetical protein [Paenibacillus taichungensis]